MNNLQVPRSETVKSISRQRLTSALRHNVPKAIDHEIPIGSDILLEKLRPRNDWLSPFKEFAVDKKNRILNTNRVNVLASVVKVKSYKQVSVISARSTSLRKMDSLLGKMLAVEAFFDPVRNRFGFVLCTDAFLNSETTISHSNIVVTEGLQPNCSFEPFYKAKKAEIHGLTVRKPGQSSTYGSYLIEQMVYEEDLQMFKRMLEQVENLLKQFMWHRVW